MRPKSLLKKAFQIFLCSFLITIVCLISKHDVFGQNSENEQLKAPQITDIVPKITTPGTYIKIAGYRLGGIDKNQVIFSQGAEKVITNASGASWESDDSVNGLSYLSLEVPGEVLVGECQVTIEFEGRQSLPFNIEISAEIKPPTLKLLTPSIARSGEFVLIDGAGFSEKDKIEILDAAGNRHILDAFGISNTGELGFTLSSEIADGLATVKVLETRSGFNQASNSLSITVSHGAVPLNLDPDDFISLAPGQWYEPVFWSNNPLLNAAKVEFLLRQGNQEQRSFVTNFKKIQFQVPTFFTAGKMEVQTRTWIKDEASEWSAPLTFEITEKPQGPIIQSLEIVPLKAEAMFRQNEKTVSVLPVYLGVLPRVPIPQELKDGNLELLTRFWDRGKFTEWKQVSKSDSFSRTSKTFYSRLEYGEEPQFQLNPFYERFYIGQNAPGFFEIGHGQYLRIYGRFFTGSVSDLQVVLENTGQIIYLKPAAQEFESMILIKIPNDIPAGDWNFSVTNLNKQRTTVSPVKLRIK